ncbi:hypothetical protein [Paenibacillus chitinolyticus]
MKEARTAPGRPAVIPSGFRWLAPYLAVWGIQGIIAAAVDFFREWIDLDWLSQGIFAAAVLASIVIWIKMRRKTGAAREGSISLVMLAFPAVMLIGAVAVLEYVQAVGPYFVALLRAFLLSVVYVLLGAAADRRLFWLGLWLFALTIVMALWYLGYSGVILQGMSGLSLLVCAWSLTRPLAPVTR